MFHLRVKIIGRSSGRSAAGAISYRVGARNGAAAMAYRAGVKLRDPKTGQSFDYSRKGHIDAEGFGILHTETMLPAGAPARLADRQILIDEIEAKEIRSDAQLLREVEISLPRELTFDQQRDLVRAIVQQMFVSKGMIADVAIHDERASDGGRNPHVHVLLTMRSVSPAGFGNKVRAWNDRALVTEWRHAWADMANDVLAAHGHERRLDARSHRAREIVLKPDVYVGPTKGRWFDGILHAARQEDRSAGKQKNIDAIAANPETLVSAVSREKATFTARDLAFALRRATDLDSDDSQFVELLGAALASPDLVPVTSDARGPVRYATRAMIACEVEMAKAAKGLARRETVTADTPPPDHLSLEQQQAFLHATQGPDLVAISGVAGAGKTTTLEAIARAFEDAGHRVRGGALAGIAAKNLADEAAIPSATLARTFNGWDWTDRDGRPDPIAPLKRGDVFILDEAGLVPSRDMRRLLVEAEKVGAKVVLVGDAQQLQAIEAGAAFRALVGTHGAAELSDVRRQRTDWQRTASQLFAQQHGPEALALYRENGAVHAAETTEQAMDTLVGAWMDGRIKEGEQLILAHTKTQVRDLNDKVRERLRAEGALGPDIRVTVREQVRDETGAVSERAQRATFAVGDRVLFTRNDPTLDVQNGATGDVLALDEAGQFNVRMKDGREVAFAIRDYPHLAPGYAMTVHKAQGATVERSYVLASRSMDAHLGYVSMTRHRDEAKLFYGRDQFEEPQQLDAIFSRQRTKDSTLDYLDAYCAREPSATRATGRSEDGRGATAPTGKVRAEKALPMSAAERVRRNAERRLQNLARDAERDRGYGD